MRSYVGARGKGVGCLLQVAVYYDADELERAGGGETDLLDVR